MKDSIVILTAEEPPFLKCTDLVRFLTDCLKLPISIYPIQDFTDYIDIHPSVLLVLDPREYQQEAQTIMRRIKFRERDWFVLTVFINQSGCAPQHVSGIYLAGDHYVAWCEDDVEQMARDIILFFQETHEERLTCGLQLMITFLIQNRLEFLFEVNNIITRQFLKTGLCEDEIINLRLTLDELGTNAIRHGNGNDPEKMVTLTCKLLADHMSITIEDQGVGFKVEGVPDPTAKERILLPSGRGIFIARQLMDSVCYYGNGNKVEFVKNIVCQ